MQTKNVKCVHRESDCVPPPFIFLSVHRFCTSSRKLASCGKFHSFLIRYQTDTGMTSNLFKL